MAIDTTSMGTKGGDSSYNTSQLRGVREERGIVQGIVKTNVDASHQGLITVWVPTFSTDQSDRSQWRQVRYCSPFYSRTDVIGTDLNIGVNTKTPSGFITPPPDIGTKVLCFFPEGRNAQGFYFACVPDVYMLNTVPESTYNANGQPVTEFNDNDTGQLNVGKITRSTAQAAIRNAPVDEILSQQLKTQGLDKDLLRGLSSSSYMRESPSEIIGLSSKGRRITETGEDFLATYSNELANPDTADKKIIEGLLSPRRRKGHSLTLDDGDVEGNSNQIRLRTSTGHQILMNDSEGVIYVGNSAGTVWIELGKQGTLDVFAEDSINFRSKNINFHADENIKMHSVGYTQFVSEQQLHLEGKEGLIAVSQNGEAAITGIKGINLYSGSDFKASSGSSMYLNSGGIAALSGSLVLLQGPKNQAKIAKPVQPSRQRDIEQITADSGILEYTPTSSIITTVDKVITHEPAQNHNLPSIVNAYTGGLQGGGGGAFSILSSVMSFANTAGFDPLGPLSESLETGTIGSILGDFKGEFSAIGDKIGSTISGITTDLGIDATTLAGTTTTGLSPGALGGALPGSENFLTNDFDKITSISSISDLANSAVDLGTSLYKDYGEIKDSLSNLLSEPIVDGLSVGDVITQIDNGFTVGILEGGDIKMLNAAVQKTVGSGGNYQYIAAGTYAVGKYGFDVEQLKSAGLVTAEAVFNDQLADANVWTGKQGINNLTGFLTNPQIQEETQQFTIVDNYQKLVNQGGILPGDSAENTVAMLTGSLTSNPDLVTKVRQGEVDLGVLKNTTNLDTSEDVFSQIKKNIQTGFSAAKQKNKGEFLDPFYAIAPVQKF